MQNALRTEIKRLSRKAFYKIQKQAEIEQKYRDQFEKRTGTTPGISLKTAKPFLSRHFDPAYCSRNANFLAKVIWYKVLKKAYEPSPAMRIALPKPDGTKRHVMAFSIPDAALANVVLRRTRSRNIKRLSPSSFAYHPDKNVFDAIISLREFEPESQLFAVQIDFEKYFDNIPSWYLKKKIDDASLISLTPHERHIFQRFIYHRYADREDYGKGVFARKHTGTPQGSSVSLLLANLANHELDTALTSSAGKFVRFADDVVALCNNYEQAQEIEKCFSLHCRKSGLVINKKKSPGIAIIAPSEGEIRTFSGFDYLGYRFTNDGLTVPDRVKRKVIFKISRLINLYLVHYLHVGFNRERAGVAPDYDWDLLGCIYEMRNYLYGGLAEADLAAFIQDGLKLPRMKGLMGFYCLIDDPSTFREIDGQMLSLLRRAMVTRNQILATKYKAACPNPSNRALATGDWLNLSVWRGGEPPEARVPSLVRGWRAARKHFFTFGLEDVQPPGYGGYSAANSGELF
ncbi:reverse transcriptase domain-containing protein [Sandarakinorhabdus oryzae]|uniref:reverse transcriptase domain-containing protein n=1 Tax=Sandarakinorhabdus oryzae TaxID=2675220 RepID=UPI0012E1A3FB|nr:reverse transcriptase domain-containing protein [Sandarakinorhabdus oryzae]